MMKKIIVMTALLLFPTTAQADWLMLNNGDRLSGEIMGQDAAGVTINTPTLGQLTIPRDKIASTHQGAAPRVLARELRTGVPMSAPVIAVTTPQAEVVPTAPIAPTKKSDTRQAGIYKWSGNINAGGSLEDGNSRSKTFTADADIKARDKINRFTLGGEANWGTEDGKKTDNDQQIYTTYDRFLDEPQKWFIGAQQKLERDEFEQLDLRSTTGGFIGHQFYERDDLNLQIKAGPEFVYEKLEDGSTDSYAALGWALGYDQHVTERVQIYHDHQINTPFDDTAAFLFESKTGARVPISSHLNASAQVDFDWDNDPEVGVQEDDTTYSLKLGYGW